MNKCPHCGSENLDLGKTPGIGAGLDLCNDCGGLSRAGKSLHREVKEYGTVLMGGDHPSGWAAPTTVTLAIDDLRKIITSVERIKTQVATHIQFLLDRIQQLEGQSLIKGGVVDDNYCLVVVEPLEMVLDAVQKFVRLRDYPPGLTEAIQILREDSTRSTS